MSKHFRGMDGSLLKANKSWSDLSNKQKDKIAGWMKDAFQKHHPEYNSKKGKYQKDLEAKKSEVNTLKRYNIIMVFSADNSRILFCKRKKPPYIGKLNFPGGKWEEGESFIEAAYRELKEETGIGKESITPLYHLMDLTYYHVNSLIECYMCRLTEEVELIQETGGNELEWISIVGTDFGNTEIFAGDGNILHCFLIAQHYMDSKK